jgi:hypothetical protein
LTPPCLRRYIRGLFGSLGFSSEEGVVMKKLLALLVLGNLAVSSVGCATPAYSAGERNKLIARTWDYEWKQAADDWDSVLLLRPPSRMTIWHVR